MIIGTAGHIDHGKTTLVKALTGVDTDRLPEEKKRGISIELGYAFLDTPQGTRLGFIDVPGHERLVHTMLAGATGMDHALLLVAADDGVMPQTREHLTVLSLLAIESLTIVITKIDRVDAGRLGQVRDEVRDLLSDTRYAQAPCFEVSALPAQGIDRLKAHLFAQALQASGRRPLDAGFRIAIDRVFTVEGIGTVVTGSVHAGQVQTGDELVLAPSATERRARVRSVHAQNRAAERARAGERCALAIAGLDRQDVQRGQWLVSPGIAVSTQRLDVSLLLWPGEAKPLRSGTPVHVHVGACSSLGSVARLDGDGDDSLAPGTWGHLQLVLREPLAAWRGDRVVLRDGSASRTLAGGEVLDPFAPARYRRTPQRLAELAALALPEAAARQRALLQAAPWGVNLARLRVIEGQTTPLSMSAADEAGISVIQDGQVVAALSADSSDQLREQCLAALARFHKDHPDEIGPDTGRLRRLAAPRLSEPLWNSLIQDQLGQSRLSQRGAFIHLPDHAARLSAVEERIAQKIAPQLMQAGFEGAWARDLARDTGEPEPMMRVTISRLAQRGEVYQVVRDLVYDAPTMHRLAQLTRSVASQQQGTVTAARFRDATGLGRKRAIQILEFFDRIGVLRRVGDEHKVRTDTRLFID